MYRKYSFFLLICNGILLLVILGMSFAQKEVSENETKQKIHAMWEVKEGYQPVVKLNVIEKKYAYNLTQEEYEILLKIVEAEAGGEDTVGKILVANVILNRVNSQNFPDSIKEVVFQKSNGVTQFSPVGNGSFDRAVASEDTIEAVERALNGEDYSMGATFFAARKYANPNKMMWFDEHLTKVLHHGGHEFYSAL